MKVLQFSALFFAITKSGTSQPIPGFSLPKEPSVVAGKVELESLGNQLQVKQFSQKAAIQWKEFNIGKDASLEFLQPNSQSSILNQVSNADPSFILGKISSNGNVFITNRNGIFFGKNATVDVGGLVASSLEIEIDDFINNEFLFKKSIKGGQIVNEGKLSSAQGGFIALLADDVRNSGIILAEKGTVALASGGQIELKFAEENNLEGIKVDASDWDALVENKHVIEAEEGVVILSANAKSKLRGGMVNNSGRILAKGILRKGGRIILTAQENGEVSNSGLVDASSKTAEGGVVTMEGRKILIDSSSITDVSGKKGGGMVLAGGDWQGGKNPEKEPLLPSFQMSQAVEVIMEKEALINASAKEDGPGGTVVLWSDIEDVDSITSVSGNIYSQGGTEGGNGGMVETSGRKLEINDAYVSTLADHGETGQWLLDPGDIDISSSGTVSSLYYSYQPTENTTIQTSAIESALNSNNLTIQTGSGGHYISVTDPISFTNNSSRKLTLNASGDIRINNSVRVNGGIRLIAGGSIELSNNLMANTGEISLQATNDLLSGANGSTVRIENVSGPIGIKADRMAFDGDFNAPSSGRTIIKTRGVLSFEPTGTNFSSDFLGGSDGATGLEMNWKGALTEESTGVYKFTADATSSYRYLEIEDYTRLGGFILNKTNSTTPVKIETELTTTGPISVMGGDVSLSANLTTNSGGIILESSDKLILGLDDSNIRLDSGNSALTLESDWIAFDGQSAGPGNGQTTLATTGILKIEPFNNDFDVNFLGGSDGATGNELNWNGNLSEVSSGIFRFTGDGSNDFRHLLIDNYTRLGGLILGKDESTVPLEIETKIDVAGHISLFGGEVLLEEDVYSTLSGGDILVKSKGKVETVGTRTFQTNNGDITFWADSDGNGEGNIILADFNTINSASGRTGDTDSSGGNITFGGGNNSGLTPNGNAVSSNLPGVKLGTTTANDTQIFSGGGNISIKGESTATSLGDDRDEAGIYQWGKMTMKSGRGAITMLGQSSTFYGIGLTDPISNIASGTKQLSIISSKTSGTAIQLTGTSNSGTGVSFNYLNPKEVLSIGGGQIQINGTGAGAGAHGISLQNQDILSSSGDIFLHGNSEGVIIKDKGARFGSRVGSGVTTSSSNLKISGDVLEYNSPTIGFTHAASTTGTVIMESHGSSFSGLFTFNDFDLDNTVSSLRIGKTTNTEDVRIIKSISIAGPIYFYGGDVYTDSDISISGGGATFAASDILRFGASNTNVMVSTGSNPITLKSDWIAFDGSGNSAGTGHTTFSLSGLLKIEPQSSDFSSEFLGGSDGVTGSELNWKGTVTEISSGVYNFVGDNTSDFKNLTIQDYTRIGGFILNKDNSVTPVRIETQIDANGLITIYGGDIFLEKDLTSTLSGADILVKGRGDIETISSRSVLTNNGDIAFWSNSDNSGGGSIILGNNNVLNSSNGRSGDTDSGGGRITLGGGSGSGTIPTGYSSSSTGAGIKLGTSTANHTEIYSGGGDISIKGSSTATGQV
ncbi:MAG: filamentous hemagglutinin N-terminal domain-containing protein, partial [Verrucomicrobiota bacterium]|nr:filamentous hemagglutinin N-terminal domain-containing protein [Verrucomicrobiota bacterium]